MGVNFSPEMSPYSGQGQFRFWCQKVLPTVYDDSLSYYELLGKVIDSLNKVITDQNAVQENVNSLLLAYNELQGYVNNYFDNLDVQNEINHKLDEMAESGELLSIIRDTVIAAANSTTETNLPSVVSNQLSGVVSNQIGGVVSSQLPAVASQQIPSAVTTWLNNNVNPGTTPIIDNSLTIADAAADARKAGNSERHIIEHSKNFYSGVGQIIFNYGTIDLTNGLNVSATGVTNRARSEYFPPPEFITLHQSYYDEFVFNLYAYTSDGTYVGTWDGCSFSKSNDGNQKFRKSKYYIAIPKFIHLGDFIYELKYRVVCFKENNEGITLTTDFVTLYYSNYSSETLIQNIYKTYPINKCTFEDGSINVNTGENVSYAHAKRTNYIDAPLMINFKENNNLYLTVLGYSYNGETYTYLGCWDGIKFITSTVRNKIYFGMPNKQNNNIIKYKVVIINVTEDSTFDPTTNDCDKIDFYFGPDATLSEEGKCADAKAVGDAIANIVSENDYLITINKNDFIQGYCKSTDGTLEYSANYISTAEYFDECAKIVINDGYIGYLCGYNRETGVYVGIFNGSTFSNTATYLTEINDIPRNYKYMLTIRTDPASSISISAGESVDFYGFTDKTLSKKNKAADAYETGIVKQNVNENLMSKMSNYVSRNVLESDNDLIAGYMQRNGTTGTGSFIRTDLIPCDAGDVFRCNNLSDGVPQTNSFRYVCCFDSEQNVVTGAGTNNATSSFTVPNGISWCVFTMTTGTGRYHYDVSRNYVLDGNYNYEEPSRRYLADFLTDETLNYINGLKNNGISTNNIENKFFYIIPSIARFTKNIEKTWFFENMFNDYFDMSIYQAQDNVRKLNRGFKFTNTSNVDSSNSFNWRIYDMFGNIIKYNTANGGYGSYYTVKTLALNNMNVMCIGDSTIASQTMLVKIKDIFDGAGANVTFLGTLGDSPTYNEGRAGWSIADYRTNKTYNSVTNPFYNSSTQDFDFSYYMTNTNSAVPKYVVLQMGINDLYNLTRNIYDYSTIVNTTVDNLMAIINSIKHYSINIRIIVNLPTPASSDPTNARPGRSDYQQRIHMFNDIIMNGKYDSAYSGMFRVSDTCIILNSSTDISDNIHPNETGYTKMAGEVVNQINFWESE